MFVNRREELKVEWRKSHDLNDQFSPSIVLVIKVRRMRWVGHLARIVERRGIYKENLKEGNHLED
jgi:hypothetical protein